MYVDEKMAAIEKIIKASKKKEGVIKQAWNLKDVIRDVKSGRLKTTDKTWLEFETSYYFNQKIPFVQIKDFYTGIRKEENQVWLTNEENHLLQRFSFSETKEKDMEQWTVQIKERCHAKNWNFIIERSKDLSGLQYCCYEIHTGHKSYYNLIFHIELPKGSLTGVFNCLHKDKKTTGILLEALLRVTHEQQCGNEVIYE